MVYQYGLVSPSMAPPTLNGYSRITSAGFPIKLKVARIVRLQRAVNLGDSLGSCLWNRAEGRRIVVGFFA
jgi:hypothetical protein